MARTTKTEAVEPTEEEILRDQRIAYLETMIEENKSLYSLTGDKQHAQWAKEQEAELKELKAD